MRAMRVMRFIILGAIGFGVGGTIAAACWSLAFVTYGASALLFILSGAVGGASLGLALGDRRRTAILALLGTIGFTFGGIVALLIAFGIFAPIPALSGSVDYDVRSAMGIAAGAIVGASLALAFLAFGDWKRRIIALTLAGGLGFGAGIIIGTFALHGIFGEDFLAGIWGTTGLYAITGIMGGASLGAGLAYLEDHRVAEERGPRVR
jgi:hypothetical protein